MIPKPIDGLTFSDVAAMVTAGGLREGRTLDLKQAPVGGRDEDKREFLADVSALANTAGGDIVFGITEAQGEATGTPGIDMADPDAETLRLEGILRTGLEPRLPRFELRWLPGPGSKGLLILRTPRSYLGPHRVTFRGHGHFYGRTNAGKTAMDVAGLRTAFLATEGLHQSIRRFRSERLGIIEAGEGPSTLEAGAKIVLHLVPLEAFAAEQDIGIDRLQDRLDPVGSSGNVRARHTVEGFVTFADRAENPEADDYALLFRSGIIESAATVGRREMDEWSVQASMVEHAILSVFASYRSKLTQKGVSLPIYVLLSLIGLRGHALTAPGSGMRKHKSRTDALLLPEVVITDHLQTDVQILRPLLDRFHNAFGLERSVSIDAVAEALARTV